MMRWNRSASGRRGWGFCERTLPAVLILAWMVVVFPGCQTASPDPCNGDPCVDGNACTTDVCTPDTSSQGFSCTHEPVSCSGGDVCDPADGSCVACIDDADCDDGLFCNGAETCDTSGAAAACVSAGDPCAASPSASQCDEAADGCVECLTDAHCPAPETCQASVCAAPPVACTSDADCPDDGLFCNGEEICDTSGSTAVCGHAGSPCAATPATPNCVEATDACEAISNPGSNFVFTTAIDTLVGTDQDDTFTANDDTYNPGDSADGGAGNDRANLVFTADENDLVDLTAIERIFVRNTFSSQEIAATGWTGYTQLWYDRGTEEVTLTQVNELADFGFTGGGGLGSDSYFYVFVDNDLVSGADDSVTILLDNAEGNFFEVSDGNNDGFENINLNLTGDNFLSQFFSYDAAHLTIAGNGSLETLMPVEGAVTVDGSAATGDISMPMFDADVTVTMGGGNDTVIFRTGEFTDEDVVDMGPGDGDVVAVTLDASVNQPASVSNAEILSVQGDDDGNAESFTLDIGGFDPLTTLRVESQGAALTPDTITLDDAALGFGIEYRGDGADTDQYHDNLRIDFVGAGGSNDAFEIRFHNQGENLDANSRSVVADLLDIDAIEHVSVAIQDGGDVTLTALNGVHLETLTIDNPGEQTFTINAIESDAVRTVDAEGSVGGVTLNIANSIEDAEVIGSDGNDGLTCGSGDDILLGNDGDDFLVGGVGDDFISGGEGDDHIRGGDGIDELDGGSGSDTFQFDGDNVDATDADVIEGFTVGNGNDILDINVATAGGGVAEDLVENALVSIETLPNKDNSFIVDSAGAGYPSFAAAEAAVEAATPATLDYALLFFNETSNRVELYIDADSSVAGGGVLLAVFEDIDNDSDADGFLGDFTAGNYDAF